MRCSRCDHENPDGYKFCAECGAELAAVCPSCESPNPPSSKFCGECGTSLIDRADTRIATAPGRAEQRLVSVLFADLVGFTPFSEARDSEEVRDVLTAYFDRARQIVVRFGGTVDKFIGDAVMAVWGALEAREDDAERAVRAALELVDMVAALGAEIGVPELALRVGVMSGETSVGPGGNEKGLVVGDLVNTASRLQSIADPGAVLVGEPTRGLTAAAVQYEPVGEQTVKGKEEPIAAFRALRVVSERGGARRAEGLEPPFTGRDVELRLLKDQFHAVGRDRAARLVSVIGDVGIGKTRLSWELEKYIDGVAADVYWHRGRSPSYGEGLTMWALAEMVRRRAGISDGDDGAKSRLKLRTAVAEYVTSEGDRAWLEPRLAALLGLESAPTGDRDELYAAFRTFFHHISALGTTVLVFDDMHWADPGLIDFVTELVERSPRHPIFVVSLARPELLDGHPGFGSGHRSSISLHLAPLPEDSMGELVRGMVPGLTDEAARSIVTRAGGIPLYAVELVRMLLAGGELEEHAGVCRLISPLDDIALPESLQAVVGARLDRLAPADRSLIQDAAVLGQSFTRSGLAIIRDTEPSAFDQALDRLVRQQIVELEDDPRSPQRGQYRFVQSVIRDVAYGRLSKADRYSRHLKVAEYFEGLEDSELVGAVASHYLAAHRAAPKDDGEDLLERGRRALSDAAARAADLQSHVAALSLLGQALALTDDPEVRASLLERSAVAASWSSQVERAVALAAEAASVYEEIGDDQGRLRALTQQATTLATSFRADEAVALLAPVYESIDEPSTVAEVALALETARAYMLNAEHQRSVEIGDRIMGRAEAILSTGQVIDGIITRATALGQTGRRLESLALLSGAVGLADEYQLQAQAIRALNNQQVVRALEVPRMDLQAMDEFRSRILRFGAQPWITRGLLDHAGNLIEHGDLEGAERSLDEVEMYPLDELSTRLVALIRTQIAVLRDPEAIQLPVMWDLVSGWDAAGDAQLVGLANGVKAAIRRLEGDHAAALEHCLENPTWEGALGAAIHALALGDASARERARAHIKTARIEGRLEGVCRQLLDAGDALAVADQAAAASAFVEAIEVLERIADPLPVVTVRALFYGLLGDAHPEAKRAGSEALTFIRASGMRRLETVWADWLPSEEAASSESA